MRTFALCLLLVTACGSSSLKKVGESCTASAECDNGLLCDLAKSVCAGKLSVDAAVGQQPDGPTVDAPTQTGDAAVDAMTAADAADDAPPD